MVKHLDIPLSRPIPLRAAQPRQLNTIEDAAALLMRYAGREKHTRRIERAVTSLMHAAETRAPQDVVAATKHMESFLAARQMMSPTE